MSTAINWRAAAMAAGFSFTLLFTGCGGGDGGSDIVAPASLEGRSYDFSPNTGGQTAVSFNSPTAYTFQHEDSTVEQGTYTAARDGNTWTVRLGSTTGGEQVYDMTFANATSGSFVLHRGGEPDRFGPFQARSSAISSGDVNTTSASTTGSTAGTTDGSTGGATTSSTTSGSTTDSTTTGTTAGSTGGVTTGSTTTSTTSGTTGSTTGSTTSGSTTGSTTSGTTGNTTGSTTGSTTGTVHADYNGFAPVSIAGRTMNGTRTFTSTGTSGQTHTYTFGNGTFHDSDGTEQADGNFTYNAGHSSATLNLTYTAPATFMGDKHALTLTFTSKDNGTFHSIYTRGDGTEITIDGTFDFEPIP